MTIRKSPTALIVLGMHGSGLPALAGVLGHLGCDLPLGPVAATGTDGHDALEPHRIAALNADILASSDFRGLTLARLPAGWPASPGADEFRRRAGELLRADYGRSALFVLDDPGMCRLLPFWQQVLAEAGYRPLYACIHRHPLDVVASLNGFDSHLPGHGLLAWLRHVLDAEAESRGQPRVFIAHERLLADWVREVGRIGKDLHLKWPRRPQTVALAIEDALRAGRSDVLQAPPRNAVLPEGIAEAYLILERWAAEGERPEDHSALDRIRLALDLAAPLFADLASRSQDLSLENRDLRKRLDEMEQAQAMAEARLAEVSQALAMEHAAGHAANHATEQQARGAAEARLAEVTAALDLALEQAAGHAANHATEQQARGAAEARLAEVTAALDLALEQAAGHAARYEVAEEARKAAQLRIAELGQTLDLAWDEAASYAANHATEQQARGAAEARLAEVTATLDLALDEAAGHAANHAAAEEARSAAEARLAELTATLDLALDEAAGHAARYEVAEEARSAAEARSVELTATLDLALDEAAGHAARYEVAEEARSVAEARLAELTATLDLALDEAAGHAARYEVAEEARSAAEARSVELDTFLTALQAEYLIQENTLARSEAERGGLEQDLHRLQSTLLQRAQETEDLHRQSAQEAERIAALDAELAALRLVHDDLGRRSDLAARHLAHMSKRMAVVMQRDLRERLDGRMSQAERDRLEEDRQRMAALTAERDQLLAVLDAQQGSLLQMQGEREQALAAQRALEDEIARVQNAARAEQERLAAELEQQRRHTLAELDRVEKAGQARLAQEQQRLAGLAAERDALALQQAELQRHLQHLEAARIALLESTSWRITAPIRRLSSVLRGNRP